MVQDASRPNVSGPLGGPALSRQSTKKWYDWAATNLYYTAFPMIHLASALMTVVWDDPTDTLTNRWCLLQKELNDRATK